MSKCPRCKSTNVRPSRVHTRRTFVARYRCRDCNQRFWVNNKRVYSLAVLSAAAFMAGTIGLVRWGVGDDFPDAAAPALAPPTSVAPNVKETIKLAEAGNPLAQYKLAQMYAQADGVPTDEKEARVWLERAAQNGNVDAQFEFGFALREGHGTLQDFERAFAILQLAAQAGHSQAQFELGRMYLSGMGVPVDRVKAYIWFNLAAANGVGGAPKWRDSVLGQLSSEQVAFAQAEARRLKAGHANQPAKAQ